jgi:hypothetical protein
MRSCVKFMTLVNLVGSSAYCLRDIASSNSVVDRWLGPLRLCVKFMTLASLGGSSAHCLRDIASSDAVVDR